MEYFVFSNHIEHSDRRFQVYACKASRVLRISYGGYFRRDFTSLRSLCRWLDVGTVHALKYVGVI